MNANEIKTAIDQGKKVFWSNNTYEVIKDNKNQYLIKNGDYCIGLTWADGTTLNGKEEDFYIEREEATTDLFEQYENLPQNVQKLIDEHQASDQDYKDAEKLKTSLEAIGYTCEYGLDSIPMNLRKIDLISPPEKSNVRPSLFNSRYTEQIIIGKNVSIQDERELRTVLADLLEIKSNCTITIKQIRERLS